MDAQNNLNILELVYTLIDSKMKYGDYVLNQYVSQNGNNLEGNERPSFLDSGEEDFLELIKDKDVFEIIEEVNKKKKKLILLRSHLLEKNKHVILDLLESDKYLALAIDEIKDRIYF